MAKEDKKNTEEKPLINCLKNEQVIVRYLPKQSRMVSNPKHVLFGGMAENATRTFVVPMLSSGRYVNVLTDDEKDFLEDIMGLPKNAMSIYKKVDNFWDDTNEAGISKVTLRKQDNYLNLANVEDYIKYKILIANKDYIAPSLEALETHPKATYQFVILTEESETKSARKGMTILMQCYTAYGKIEDDVDALRIIIETLTGITVHKNTKKEFLQTKINELIQSNSKMFLKIATDPLLQTKVLIRKCIESGLIAHRGNQYYIREGNIPMCEDGEPTLNVAAQWINLPKNQEIKLSLEAKLK
ncbi:MAG TPA: hypothetical protein VFC79_03160 [Tissierellaceae bacterium]|nr:hypothetical protein [Tissierellaceae bacterium]